MFNKPKTLDLFQSFLIAVQTTNLFRITQTELKLKKDKNQNLKNSQKKPEK